MFWALFFYVDFAAILENGGVQNLEAIGANRFRVFDRIHAFHCFLALLFGSKSKEMVMNNKVSKRFLR